jgi:hypothetical protein
MAWVLVDLQHLESFDEITDDKQHEYNFVHSSIKCQHFRLW